ncbi:diaminohydroxyphosphoribosylaminopyrimidine deaminase, partial [Salmonella enterica subsp. enterica]|nr:diaminohydroxyphosphoribosylaminopyrimidine deaminase [Salmonella enterica subsp. enterica]
SFHKGQELCEIETSKIVNVLEAPCDGVMCRFIAKIGETLPVGAVLAVCADQRISEEEADAWIKKQNIAADIPHCNEQVAVSTSRPEKEDNVDSARPAAINSSEENNRSESEYIPEILKGNCT